MSGLFIRCFNFLKNYKFSLLLFGAFVLIVFVPNNFAFSVSLFLNAASLMLIVFLLAKIPNKLVKIILNIIFIFFICLSVFFVIEFKDYIWPEYMLAILRTDPTEIGEMASSFLISGILVIAVTVSLILLSEKELKKAKFVPVWIPLIAFAVYVLAFVPYRLNIVTNQIRQRDAIDLSAYSNALYLNYVAPFFYGAAYSTYAALNELSYIKDIIRSTEDRKLPESVSVLDSAPAVERIIVVMGESSRKASYSLYGYERKTTPFLDSLRNVSDTSFYYYDAVSPATSTVASIYRMMSFATIADTDPAFRQKTAIDLAVDKGYETYWLSNQNPIGDDDTQVGVIALSSKHQKYLQDGSANITVDMQMIPEFKKVYNPQERQFIFLHLKGSHMLYSKKYDDIDRVALKDSLSGGQLFNTTDDYDRSIHQTDRVLRELYNTVKRDTSLVLLYLSDHGEIIGVGHGVPGQPAYQYEVPFLAYNFSSLPVDSLVSRYTNPDSKRFNGVNLSYILAELSGYNISEAKRREALEDGEKVYLYNGTVVKYESLK